MSDTESNALFKICAELQKEIRDLKHDDDSRYLEVQDLRNKIMTVESMVKAIFNLLAK